MDQPGRRWRRADIARASPASRCVPARRARIPDALSVRVRGLHGQLRQHAGPVVSPGGGRGGGRGSGRSRRAPKPGRSGRCRNCTLPESRPEIWGRGACRRGVARAVLEDNRIAQAGLLGTALQVAADLDVAGTAAMLLEPFRVEMLAPEHAWRARGGGRAVRRAVDPRRHRRVVRAGASLRTGQVPVGGEPAGAVRGTACRRGSAGGAAAGRRGLGLDGRPVAVRTATARAGMRSRS